mgnify:CR=1 FL=1
MTDQFKTHKAKLILHNDNFYVIDFRREDGRREYFVRFFIDTNISSVHIEGDLGYSISIWGNSNSLKNISDMMLNVSYWMEKFECSSDRLIWNEREARNQLEEYTYGYYEECLDKDEYYEMIDEIMDTFYDDRGIVLDTEAAYRHWFSELELYDVNPARFGRKIHPRVYLWAEAFDLALRQLKLKV